MKKEKVKQKIRCKIGQRQIATYINFHVNKKNNNLLIEYFALFTFELLILLIGKISE